MKLGKLPSPTANRFGDSGLRLSPTVKVKGAQIQRKNVAIEPNPSDAFVNWDWDGRIRPQFDYALAHGANTVKWSGGTRSVVDGRQTRAQLHACISQFIEYAGQRGLYVYWSSHFYSEDLNPANDQATLDEIVAMMELVGSYENVIGNDLSNETNANQQEAHVQAHLEAVVPPIRAVTDLPLSLSLVVVGATFTQPEGWSTSAMPNIAPYVDFWDFHPYYGVGDPGPADLSDLRRAAFYKPWMVGECGEHAGEGEAAQRSRWRSLARLMWEQDCSGVVGYTIQDADTRDFAMYADDGTERTHISSEFDYWPVDY